MRTVLALALMTSSALAQDVSSFSAVRVLPGYMTQDGQYLAGVEVTMAPGWKTYWRQPGEGGIPPIFDWSGSTNVSSAQIEWPVPEVFETYGLRSLGYHDHVVFPVLFDIVDPDAQTALSLSLSFGLCSDICIPANALAATQAPLQQVHNATLLGEARDHVTEQAQDMAVHCSVVPAAGAWRLDAEVAGEAEISPDLVAVFEANDPALWIGTPDAVQQGDGLLFSAPMDWFGEGAFALSRQDMRITLVESGRSAVEIRGC